MNKLFILRNDMNAQALYLFLRQNWLAMADEGRPLAISITEHKAKRSLEQNKFYWMLLNKISENGWVKGKQFSADAWSEMFKRLFIGAEEMPNGEMVGISTTKLNVEEFAAYITRIEVYASDELGIEE